MANRIMFFSKWNRKSGVSNGKKKTSDGLAFRAVAPLKRLVLFVDLNIDPPSVRTAKCV